MTTNDFPILLTILESLSISFAKATQMNRRDSSLFNPYEGECNLYLNIFKNCRSYKFMELRFIIKRLLKIRSKGNIGILTKILTDDYFELLYDKAENPFTNFLLRNYEANPDIIKSHFISAEESCIKEAVLDQGVVDFLVSVWKDSNSVEYDQKLRRVLRSVDVSK
ncbi:hypothetical protein C0584_04930 [Candidatus Parcubacteria bacterium]|nr:MAG: hypothetical protein C0584_04930 [Candidatus Parcubacteria bacterium]